MKPEKPSTWSWEERDIVYIHKVESVSGAIRMFSRIGMRRPLYCTGVGKAILATWPDEEARALWRASDVRPWTPYTIVDEAAFFQELAQVRRLGYAMDNEENELGVRCIAAAIPDYRRARLVCDLGFRAADAHVGRAHRRAACAAARNAGRDRGGDRRRHVRKAVTAERERVRCHRCSRCRTAG